MSGSLTDSPADIIRALLVHLSLGTEPSADGAWPVYSTQEPDTPDNCLTVYDTAGTIQDAHQTDGEVQETHGFQVRVRSADHATGYTKARAIAVALDPVYLDTVTIASSTYLVYSILRGTDVISLGKETPASFRNVFTLNAVATLRQTS